MSASISGVNPKTSDARSPWPGRIVRWVLGGVLLAAAVLKGHQLLTEPYLGPGVLNSRWLNTIVVGFNFALGTALLSRWLSRVVTGLAVGAFTCYASFSIAAAITGSASCGCFGEVRVHPIYTAAFDIVAAFAVAWVATTQPAAHVRMRWFHVGALLVVPAVFGALIQVEPWARPRQDGSTAPQEWIGKPWPMLDAIDIGGQLRQGDWIVCLHRRDCHRCQAMLPELLRSARILDSLGPSVPRVALVELPSTGEHDNDQQALPAVAQGRVSQDREWPLETPTVVRLAAGVVADVEVGSVNRIVRRALGAPSVEDSEKGVP